MGPTMKTGDDAGSAFGDLYAAHFDAVLGFALRRTDRPEDAADVTAETFVVAWRRLRHVPTGDGTRPWLYGVARRVLANHRRGESRRAALGNRLRRQVEVAWRDPGSWADAVVHRTDVTAAMTRLSARDEEILQLHLWEGLEPREIADVLGLPGTVVRPRLSRAKARLRELLGEDVGNDPGSGGHPPSRRPELVAKEEHL